eukprot:4017685-Prorocentrum_lima.AAC.1
MAKATGKSNKEVETMTNLINRRSQEVQGEHIEPDVEMGDTTELREIAADNQELQRQNRGYRHQVILHTGNIARLNDIVDAE